MEISICESNGIEPFHMQCHICSNLLICASTLTDFLQGFSRISILPPYGLYQGLVDTDHSKIHIEQTTAIENNKIFGNIKEADIMLRSRPGRREINLWGVQRQRRSQQRAAR